MAKDGTSIPTDILDLEAAAEKKHDWHSTHTFQVFLDALDINQVINIPKKSNSENTSIQEEKVIPIEKNKMVETILSAEALKILSELPDLRHMSATRSFMYPK